MIEQEKNHKRWKGMGQAADDTFFRAQADRLICHTLWEILLALLKSVI